MGRPITGEMSRERASERVCTSQRVVVVGGRRTARHFPADGPTSVESPVDCMPMLGASPTDRNLARPRSAAVVVVVVAAIIYLRHSQPPILLHPRPAMIIDERTTFVPLPLPPDIYPRTEP